MVPSKKPLALVAIVVLTLNSFLYLNTDPYLQQLQYTTITEADHPEDNNEIINLINESTNLRASTAVDEPETEEEPPSETNEQLTLRILNRRDRERRMDDANLQYIDEYKQQIMRSSKGLNEQSYICNRPADLGTTQHSKCPGSNNSKQLLLLDGTETYGRIGNNLMEFLHALQYSRAHDIQLGVKYGSWAMRLLPRMWLSVTGDQSQWEAQFEKAFCIKIIHTNVELKNYDVIRLETKDLLLYKSNQSFEEYASFQQQALRTLYQNYNTGDGTTLAGFGTRDMCSGIHALFGKDSASAIYSVIHLRRLEKVGYTILAAVSKHTGCDPRAAIEMRPDYVRTILKPLGMLNYPIVVIGDGQSVEAIQRLLDDPEIGPRIVFVPEEAVWNGGDMTLGVMSNVFIGNPASSFSGFIAKSRLALGKGHNYLFRARGDDGKWQTVCGDSCVFNEAVNHF